MKNYSYAVVDGEVYYRQNSVMVKPNLTASAKERVKGMVELRDRVQQLIDMQMNEYTPDSAIQEKQGELSQLYDNFAKKFGLINDRGNRLAFSADSAYYLLCALEVLDENGKLERKADMFTKRTIKPHRAVTSADTAMDALAISIGERAGVDLRFMAQLTGKTEDTLIGELRGVIFKDPLASGEPYEGWQTADEYLSGNVRQKLRAAEVYAANDPAYQVNVEALTAAQPKDLDASEIEVRLGATWIDKQYIQQFMYETLKTPYYLKGRIRVSYSEHTPVEIGSYRGFSMSVSMSLFKHELVLKGEMTHKTDLGQDPRGNVLRIDNALDKMPDRLTGVKAQLDNLFAQQAAAKEEVGKPFPQEDELRQKSARLAELDSLLNIDGRQGHDEQAIAKSARPSLLESLKRPAQPGPDAGRNRKPYQKEMEEYQNG